VSARVAGNETPGRESVKVALMATIKSYLISSEGGTVPPSDHYAPAHA